MRRNNYTHNANGPSIEVTCYYDSIMARTLWEDNFTRIEGTDVFLYTDYRQISDTVTFRIAGNKKDKCSYLRRIGGYERYTKKEMVAWSHEELDSEIFNSLESYPTLANYEESEAEIDDNLSVVPSTRVLSVIIDNTRVVYLPDELKIVGASESKLRNYFSQLFFDSPVFCCVTIDQEIYYYEDFASDSYVWEPERFADFLAEKNGVDKQELLKLLLPMPDHL